MAQSDRKSPQDNPFWTYRDPITGRWLTVMTPKQWQQTLNTCPFEPKIRQIATTGAYSDPDQG